MSTASNEGAEKGRASVGYGMTWWFYECLRSKTSSYVKHAEDPEHQGIFRGLGLSIMAVHFLDLRLSSFTSRHYSLPHFSTRTFEENRQDLYRRLVNTEPEYEEPEETGEIAVFKGKRCRSYAPLSPGSTLHVRRSLGRKAKCPET